MPPNKACTRSPHEQRGHGGGSLRVFRQFVWLEVDSIKVALSRPAHQRVTQAVRQLFRKVKEGSVRRIRYQVAMSLDGYIAGPKGEADWIIMDQEIDFAALFEQFDTFLVGRRTFEAMARAGQGGTPGTKTFVFSRTLRQQDYPRVT